MLEKHCGVISYTLIYFFFNQGVRDNLPVSDASVLSDIGEVTLYNP